MNNNIDLDALLQAGEIHKKIKQQILPAQAIRLLNILLSNDNNFMRRSQYRNDSSNNDSSTVDVDNNSNCSKSINILIICIILIIILYVKNYAGRVL